MTVRARCRRDIHAIVSVGASGAYSLLRPTVVSLFWRAQGTPVRSVGVRQLHKAGVADLAPPRSQAPLGAPSMPGLLMQIGQALSRSPNIALPSRSCSAGPSARPPSQEIGCSWQVESRAQAPPPRHTKVHVGGPLRLEISPRVVASAK